MQRLFDIVISGLALLVLLPLFVVVICILKITGEGEVFFLQKRIGINRNPFMGDPHGEADAKLLPNYFYCICRNIGEIDHQSKTQGLL